MSALPKKLAALDSAAPATVHQSLVAAANRLSRAVDQLTFHSPVTHVYNPLTYARKAHHQYLRMSQPASTRVLFLGMNPGPWGMAQTGVPFGEVDTVKNWLGIDAEISQPANEHPKRKVEGLACTRSEVSGQRLWGLFHDRFQTPQRFFHEHFVINYCPLVFMESTGRNRTPDKLPAAERTLLDQVCDDHLRCVIQLLAPLFLVGVGAYAEACLTRVTTSLAARPQVLRILHPSPASPAANRGWAARATQELVDAGVWSAQ